MSQPTLAELLGSVVSTALGAVNTAIPARVVAFYPEERKADVQPLIRKQMADGSTIEYPVIPSVPVQYPGSSNSLFYFPLVKGDPLLLVFCQTSTDTWLFSETGGIVEPQDNHRFNITDAFAIPGVFPFPLSTTIWDSQTLTKDTSSVIIKHNLGTASEAEIVIDTAGQISMTSPVKVAISAPSLDVDGDINSTGTITGDVDVMTGIISLKLHRHPATPPVTGSDLSGFPIP